MAKTKYFATLGDKKFNRSTDRVYTHMVTGRRSESGFLVYYIAQAKYDAKTNYAFYAREGGDNPQYNSHTVQELSSYRRIAAMTQEQYRAELIAAAQKRHADEVASGFYTEMLDLGWCGRPDLAEKLAAKSRKDGYLDVQILEAQK